MTYDRRFWLFIASASALLVIAVIAYAFIKKQPPDLAVSLSAYFLPAPATPSENVTQIAVGATASPASSASKQNEHPEINNSERAKFEIRGYVQKGGKAVQGGKVKLTVQPWGSRFHQSILVPVGSDGSFRVSDDPAFRDVKDSDQLVITAEVWCPGQPKMEEVVYRNYPVPKWLWASFATLVSIMGGVFLWSFTGQVRRIKNRAAIMLSYCVILMSLGIALIGPILLIRGIPALTNLSSSTPVGLIVAKLTEDSKPEWMLNIGGYRISGESISTIEPESEGAEVEGAQQQNATDSTPEKAPTQATPVLQVLTLKGGMQVPLYVIILALIGGAINMTRQIPRFQLDIDEREEEEERPVAIEDMTEAEKIEHGSRSAWRRGLLEQYMYLLSAPFLAIATYYLLILLGTVQPSIIVLVCFSIGLVSDTVVNAITDVVKKALGGGKVGSTPEAGAK